MTKVFLKWWLAFVVQAIAVGVIALLGGAEYVLMNDKTYISSAIVGLWFVTSLTIGYNVYWKRKLTDMQWFVTDSCMNIGMIGTVIGFIIMLSTSLSTIDPGNIESMRAVISMMAMGMSIALLTTLAGLVAHLFLRLQMTIAEASDETT